MNEPSPVRMFIELLDKIIFRNGVFILKLCETKRIMNSLYTNQIISIEVKLKIVILSS